MVRRWREGEMERRKDGEKGRRRDGEMDKKMERCRGKEKEGRRGGESVKGWVWFGVSGMCARRCSSLRVDKGGKS